MLRDRHINASSLIATLTSPVVCIGSATCVCAQGKRLRSRRCGSSFPKRGPVEVPDVYKFPVWGPAMNREPESALRKKIVRRSGPSSAHGSPIVPQGVTHRHIVSCSTVVRGEPDHGNQENITRFISSITCTSKTMCSEGDQLFRW